MATVYVAQPGDSLSKIMQRAGASWSQEDWRNRTLQVNPNIKDPNIISVNQLVLVPESPNEIILQERIDYVTKYKNAMNDPFLRHEIERFARNKEEAKRKQLFLSKLDKIHGITGAGVVYYDKYNSPVIIRKPSGSIKKTLIIRETPKIKETNPVDGRFVSELTGTIFSCSAFVLGAIAIFTGTVFTPFTGGASTAVVVLAFSATAASGLQCVNGGYRTYEVTHGKTESVDWLDSQEWYVYTTMALDTISVAGGVGATTGAVKTVLALKRASSKTMFDILKGLQRAERKRLTQEIARLNFPGISNKALKAMVRAGAIPKRYTQAQITNTMRSQIIDLFGAGASMIGSGLNGIINKAGSSVSLLLLQEISDT